MTSTTTTISTISTTTTTTTTTSTTSTNDCGDCPDWLSPVLFWSVTASLAGVVLIIIFVFCCFCFYKKRKKKKLKKTLDSNQKFGSKPSRSRTKTNGTLGRFNAALEEDNSETIIAYRVEDGPG